MQGPPAAVRALGGRILRQVNRSNQRPVDLGAVRAWHKVFVPRWAEVRAPGGGEWKVSEQFDDRMARRAMRGRGKALAADGVQNSLWGRAPEWVIPKLLQSMREIADTRAIPLE